MTMQLTRPRGRRPGKDDTRGTIATSALDLFATQGYDKTSLRAIARQADVDPGLVHHYYSSKAHLLVTVLLDEELDVPGLVAGLAQAERSVIGSRLSQALFDLWEHPKYRRPITDFLGTDEELPRRTRLLGEFLAREVFARLAAELGHTNHLLRGALASSTVIGLMLARDIVRVGTLPTVSTRHLIEPVGRLLQNLLADEW